MKQKAWRGKLNHHENKCPHCGAYDEYSDVAKTVMELSAQHYKVCIKCQGKFVDTYLIVHDREEYDDRWILECRWENEDQVELFDEIHDCGILEYDSDNPNDDDEYYELQPNSIHFIKGDDDE